MDEQTLKKMVRLYQDEVKHYNAKIQHCKDQIKEAEFKIERCEVALRYLRAEEEIKKVRGNHE